MTWRPSCSYKCIVLLFKGCSPTFNEVSKSSINTMANAISHLGWIGLGNMGLAMAANLQRHLQGQGLPPLQVWNRTACKADAVTALGATQCASIAEVVRRSDIIFISVRAPYPACRGPCPDSAHPPRPATMKHCRAL